MTKLRFQPWQNSPRVWTTNHHILLFLRMSQSVVFSRQKRYEPITAPLDGAALKSGVRPWLL